MRLLLQAWSQPRSREKRSETHEPNAHIAAVYGVTTVRKGQAPDLMPRSEFSARFRAQFYDPAFRPHDAAINAMEAIAWDAYRDGHKAAASSSIPNTISQWSGAKRATKCGPRMRNIAIRRHRPARWSCVRARATM